MKRGAYVAAANRARYVVENYQTTPAVPDALAVMAKAYKVMELNDLSQDTLRVLQLNYPDHPGIAEVERIVPQELSASRVWPARPGARSEPGQTPLRPRPRRSRRCGFARPAPRAETKIFPSPIFPVLAASAMASRQGLDLVVGDHDVELHLGQEVDDVLRAAVELGVPLLAPETLHLGRRHARDTQLRERLAHIVELERLDDGLDLLHSGLGISWKVYPSPRVAFGAFSP